MCLIVSISVFSFTGIGLCISYVGSYIAICWLFYPDPGVALVSLSIGGAVGHGVLPLLLEALLSQYGLHGCLLMCSGLTLQCAPSGLLLHSLRQYFVQENEAQEKHETSSSTNCSVYKSLFSDVVVLLILTNSFLMFLTGKSYRYIYYTICFLLKYFTT